MNKITPLIKLGVVAAIFLGVVLNIPAAGAEGFTRNLKVGDRGEDVKLLQVFLNTHQFPVAKNGPGSKGNESTYFGFATKQALLRFQEYYADAVLKPFGLKKGTGNFYAQTRKFVKNFTQPLAYIEQTSTPVFIATSTIPSSTTKIALPLNVSSSTNSASPLFTIKGNLSGAAGEVVVQNNNQDDLSLTSNGNFVFTTPLLPGQTYAVSVIKTPTIPLQICNVFNGSGKVGNTNVENVSVVCTDAVTSPGISARQLFGPSITFGDIVKYVGDSAFTLSPSSNSGGAFSFSSSRTSVATVSGNTCTVVGAGTSTITASQAAAGNYSVGAANATLTVYVNQCITAPCLNGGTCTPNLNSYTCTCSAPYSGADCEMSDVNCNADSGAQCLNGGACSPTPTGGECQCAPCFSGPQCENYICQA